jgi:hypothetical protein
MKIKPTIRIDVPHLPNNEQFREIQVFAHTLLGGYNHERTFARGSKNGGQWSLTFNHPKEARSISSEPTPEEQYLKGHEASGIQVGDTVKVTRKAKRGVGGWDVPWVVSMDRMVGQSLTVKREATTAVGFLLGDGGDEYWFPYFVLEKVTPEPTHPVTEKPPLGIMPEKIWIEQRILALTAAIDRYISTGKDPDQKWIEELQVRLDRHRNISSKPL